MHVFSFTSKCVKSFPVSRADIYRLLTTFTNSFTLYNGIPEILLLKVNFEKRKTAEKQNSKQIYPSCKDLGTIFAGFFRFSYVVNI